MKKLLSLMMCAFLSFSLAACGGGGGGGGSKGPKPTLLPDGNYMTFAAFPGFDIVSGNDIIIFEPVIFNADEVDQEDFDTTGAIWTVNPASAGDFVNPDPGDIGAEPMYAGTKQFNFNGTANKVTITLELNGYKFAAALKLSDILGYDPTAGNSGGNYEFQAVRVQCSSNEHPGFYLDTGEGTSFKWNEVANMKARIRTMYGDYVDDLTTTWHLSRTDIVSLSSNTGSNVILTCNNTDQSDPGLFYAKVVLTVVCDGHSESFTLAIDNKVYRPNL